VTARGWRITESDKEINRRRVVMENRSRKEIGEAACYRCDDSGRQFELAPGKGLRSKIDSPDESKRGLTDQAVNLEDE